MKITYEKEENEIDRQEELVKLKKENEKLAIVFSILIIVILVEMIYIIITENRIVCDKQNYPKGELVIDENERIRAFNSQFAVYEGKQTGAKLKSMLGTLIANGNTYRDEPNKIPQLLIYDENISNNNNIDVSNNLNLQHKLLVDINEGINNYITELEIIRRKIENKHTYSVEFVNGEDGIIESIIIYY